MRRVFVVLALVCAAVPGLAEEAADASDPAWTAGLADEKLVAVDDSTVTLSPMEGRLTLEFVSHSGGTQKTIFSFVSDKMGTVADDDSGGKITGFFRQTDIGLEIQYEDGRQAALFANVADGLTMTRRGAGGESVCVSWYPKDHVFSAAERRAAVEAYAQSLGVDERPGTTAKTKSKTKKKAVAAPATASICSPAMRAPKQRVVRDSTVRPLESAASATPAPVVETPVPVKTAPPEVVPSGAGASQCLSVEVQGAYIGFRNRCGNDVQVVYCLEKWSDAALSCGTGTKQGAITASGFSGVLADSTAAEHDIRWVACSGAASDVAAELLRADPPAGRCVKKTP